MRARAPDAVLVPVLLAVSVSPVWRSPAAVLDPADDPVRASVLRTGAPDAVEVPAADPLRASVLRTGAPAAVATPAALPAKASVSVA